MSNVGVLYMRGMHGECSLLAAWLPTSLVKLGDVGVLEKESFTQTTTLEQQGIPFQVRRGRSPGELKYESGADLGVTGSGGVAAGGAEASASLTFSKKGGFLFHAAGCRTDAIVDKDAVGNEIVKRLGERTWKPRWAVVDSVVSTDWATILISSTDSSSAELSGKAPMVGTNLADLKAGLSVRVSHGKVMQYVAKEKLTPLFTLSRLKRSLADILFPGRPGEFDRVETGYAADFGGERGGRTISVEKLSATRLQEGVLEAVPPP